MAALDTAPARGPARMKDASPAGLRARLASVRFGLAAQIAVWAIVIGTLTAATVSVFAYRGNVAILVERQQRALATSVDLAAGRIAMRFDSAERDAVFLGQTPTVGAFARAIADGGVAPADGADAAILGDRVAALLQALLEARPAYFDALLLDAGGHEVVRVNRNRDGDLVRTATAQLQDKSERTYFVAASRLPPGAVFVSDIELNRERGAVELPYRPTSHVAAPLYSGSTLVGVIVLDLELKSLFDVINQTLGPDNQHIVTNESGDYLIAPLSEKAFGFDHGKRYRLQEDYPELTPLLAGGETAFSGEIQRPAGEYLAVGQRVAFDPAHPQRFVVVAAILSSEQLLTQTRSLRDWTALVASLMILAGVAFAVLLSRLIVRPLHALTDAARSIAAGDRNVDFGATAGRSDETGELARVMTLMMQEIGEREQRLTAQAEELTRSNQELAQFAYVASHDLQEPLRMVGSYLELLARRYEGKLDDEAQEFIGFAVDGATRMKRLINDLLGYSRAGNSPLKLEDVDVQKVVDTVLAQLALQIGETNAGISVGAMPKLRADPIQLARVFQNLIENALKYRSAERRPSIAISAERTRAGWRFVVADNGIGIDPQFKDKIFEIFKRLHGRERYAGTGIGLAVTKLVVERHGGRIWVEPAVGGGSVFTFTIPDKAA